MNEQVYVFFRDYFGNAKWHPGLSGAAEVAYRDPNWIRAGDGVWYTTTSKGVWAMLTVTTSGPVPIYVMGFGYFNRSRLQGALNRFLVEYGNKPWKI